MKNTLYIHRHAISRNIQMIKHGKNLVNLLIPTRGVRPPQRIVIDNSFEKQQLNSCSLTLKLGKTFSFVK